MARTMTPKEIALDFGTTPKKLRKFLRSPEGVKVLKDAANPGKGSRYAIPATTVKALKTRFNAWNAANGATTPEAPKPTRTRAKRPTTPDPVETVEAPDAPETPNEGNDA